MWPISQSPDTTSDKILSNAIDSVNPSPGPWYRDLDTYIAVPRITHLALSPDGSTVIVEISQLNEKKTAYISSLWWVDPAGEKSSRRLTFSVEGESGAHFTSSGDILFLSDRPQPDNQLEDKTTAIWKLPLNGGEAQVLAHRSGGFNQIIPARNSPVIAATGKVLAGAHNETEDAQFRKERKETTCSAIVHNSVPIRYWDSDLDLAYDHLFSDTADSVSTSLQDHTPGVAHELHLSDIALSPTGEYAIATWNVPHKVGEIRQALRYISLNSDESFTLISDPGADVFYPQISPDGNWLIFLRYIHTTPTECEKLSLHITPISTVQDSYVAEESIIELIPHWDRMINEYTWLDDSSGIILTADDQGRAPIFRIDLGIKTGDLQSISPAELPVRITQDDAAYSDIHIEPNGKYIYALRSSYLAAPHPVRIDCTSSETIVLPSIAEALDIPGTIEDVSTQASDGTCIRGWLLLPENSSAQHPVPLLLVIHGGPISSWNSWTWRWNPWLLVSQGYAVLLPDPALSTGYGRDFIQRGWGKWGEAPYTDLLAITDEVLQREEINATRTAALGGSFGGYMANWIAGHTDRFRAIVTHASPWALDQFRPTTDCPWYWDRQFTPTSLQENSPHHFVGKISTPMLVIHGDKDYRVPIGDGIRLWNELLTRSALPIQENGDCVHKFLYFPDENHWILKPQNSKAWYTEVFSFLKEHLSV